MNTTVCYSTCTLSLGIKHETNAVQLRAFNFPASRLPLKMYPAKTWKTGARKNMIELPPSFWFLMYYTSSKKEKKIGQNYVAV